MLNNLYSTFILLTVISGVTSSEVSVDVWGRILDEGAGRGMVNFGVTYKNPKESMGPSAIMIEVNA